MTVSDAVRDDDTLPRRNGELVFDAPWQSRAFSVAVALADEGRCDWEEFRSRLIAEIGERDERAEWHYYEHWLAALERLLVERGLVTMEELERRTAETAHAAAHEHDHEHTHGHDHHHEGARHE